MNLQFSSKSSKTALVIEPIFTKGKNVAKDRAPAPLRKKLAALAKSKEFEGKSGQVFFLFPERMLLVGLGEAKKLKTGDLMEAFGAAVKSAAHHHPATLALHMREELTPFARAITEAAILATYHPAVPYKTGTSLKKIHEQKVETLEIFGATAETKKPAEEGFRLGLLQNELRDWVNAPPNYANADFFDQKAKEISKETGARLTILKKKEITKLGMGALLGVNRGSPDEPRLTILEYKPSGITTKEPPLVFVGKGILFDSGGYNLKPRGSIEDMQLDKAGAATVFMLIRAAHMLGLKRHIVAVAPFTENLIGSKAQKPSEIVTTYSGKTIEITNTDGEGRLVLSDAMAYAEEMFKPEFLIDIATLTGACMVALGDRYAGLFGNNSALMRALRKAGKETDELLWPLPLHKDHSEKMKGHYADLRNADLGSERDAGASKGAAFLKAFVKKAKWAHLDIAGPAWTNNPKKYETKGATGFGLRVLVKFLENAR